MRDSTWWSVRIVNDEIRWQLLQLPILEKRIAAAVVFLREHRIETILIKGWAAAQLYPDPVQRPFGDIDLIVSSAQYNYALEILDKYKDKQLLDLHKGTRHLDTVPFENLFKNSKLVKCGADKVRILRPEDHLRILCVHWLTDGGAYKNRLWDIFYAVENRPTDFDWSRCLGVVSKKRRKWIISAIGLAHKYLGLDVTDTPIAAEISNLPRWLIKTVEKEWRSDVRLVPMHYYLHDRKMLWQQVKKRIPPNPIQATINMEGEFDENPRVLYQIGDVLMRLLPSLKRILKFK